MLHENTYGQSSNMYVTSIRGKVEYDRPVASLPRMCPKQASAVFLALKVILLLLTTLRYVKYVKRKNWEAEQAFLLLMDHQKVTFVTNTALLWRHH